MRSSQFYLPLSIKIYIYTYPRKPKLSKLCTPKHNSLINGDNVGCPL